MDSSQWLILGNGFDLQAGLKSTFADFYSSRYNLNKIDLINYNWKDNLLKNRDHISIWDLLICTYLQNNSDSLRDWKDVEGIIKEVLQGVHGTNIHFSSDIFKDATKVIPISWQFEEMIDKSSELNNEEQRSLGDYWLCYYIIKHLMNSYPYFKKYVNDQADCGDSDHFMLNLNIIRSILTPLLLKELKEFESSFSQYLDEQITSDKEYEQNAKKLYEIVVADSTISTQVLSFNYTPKINNDILVYRNIHGSLEGKNIIFGIDASFNENEESFDPYLVKFTKTSRILKLTNNSITTNETDWNGQNVDRIVIYGHSLGEADYSYFQSIFDSVNLYQSATQLVFAYSIYDSDRLEEIETTYETAVEKLMTRYGQSFSNQNHGRNLLHKLLLEGRIQIRLI
ncbi:MAG: AbiH family protein [Leuconostoc gelidum]|jgi:hypothetical protein|uniref:AbiH family protein n=1 Tax=Leuconostoc gelidum TaxID=1244 RepID=UPI002F35DC4C